MTGFTQPAGNTFPDRAELVVGAQVRFEPGHHRCRCTLRVCPPKAMVSPLDNDELALDAMRLECLVHPVTVAHLDETVLIAVNELR